MSAPRPDKSALPDPSYHWMTLKARVFLGALADFGRVAEAARVVGMGRQSAYRLRRAHCALRCVPLCPKDKPRKLLLKISAIRGTRVPFVPLMETMGPDQYR